MAISRSRIVLRDMGDIFPSPLPTEYLFLESGQPLNHKISVRHPHNNDVLFTLFAWDHKDGALHYGLLHTACAIVADNRHDGYLSASRDCHAERINLHHDDLVPCQPTDYYFHVPDNPDYPVVPTFDDWRFPNSLPPAWLCVPTDNDNNNAAQATTQSNFSAGVKLRDRTCRLSNHSSATETAHLCPEKEEAWYLRNDMQVWNLNQISNYSNITRDIANCLLLCSNLHKTFDDRIWVFFPKGPNNSFVAHFLQAAPDQAALYHNVAARPVRCDPHFLYARFAWAIFSLLRPYFSKSMPRRVKLWVASEGEWQERTMDSQQLRSHVRPSRSSSPTKRSRRLEDAAIELDHLRTIKRHKYSRSVSTDLTTQSTVTSPSLIGDGNDCRGSVQIRGSADLADEQAELEEDLALMRRRFPELEGMPESQKPTSWYPGWRHFERMKQAGVAADRKRSITPLDAQQIDASDQYGVTGRQSVLFAPITDDDGGDDNSSHKQKD